MTDRRDDLFFKPKNGYDRFNKSDVIDCFAFADDYKTFINDSKTEREFVENSVDFAAKNGFVPYKKGMELKAGDRIYSINRDKALMLAVIGKKTMDFGANIAASHIDSPRLDVKACPVYEDTETVLFKTHYYGGIKKYQWVAIPLELHGVVILKDGTSVKISVGEKKDDPIFTITDLLPHLGKDQLSKTLGEGIQGESLNPIVGSMPYDCDGTDRVKLAVLSILNDTYGIREEDFISAELSFVPAFEARDIGFDKSLIGAYGHDDRVCAYATLRAIADVEVPELTSICMLADKEEIGSEGVSGMLSEAFEKFCEDICIAQGKTLRECFANSFCLSADVCAAFDPNYPEVNDKLNCAKVNYGVGICKYTGVRGKAGASDASAEVVAKVRKLFDDNNVIWQMAPLGKVDQGGGGTVAKFMAMRNIDTIDAGVPVLSMHSPYEVVSKLDLYMTYKATLAVYTK